MTDRPIIFSAPMVRALLDGRKTQTRRVLRVQPYREGPFWRWHGGAWGHGEPTLVPGHSMYERAPYHRDDRLWVREAWQLHSRARDLCTVAYRSSIDGSWAHEQYPDRLAAGMQPKPFQAGWRSSIHMPRWASRLTLTVTEVRVQRLQEIKEEDAVAEGLHRAPGGWWSGAEGQAGVTPRAAYGVLWNSLHGPGAWSANPWVVTLTFSVERANIDAFREAA